MGRYDIRQIRQTTQRRPYRWLLPALVLLALTAMQFGAPSLASAQVVFVYNAGLSGSEIMPPTESAGWASISANFDGPSCPDESANVLYLGVSWSNLEGSPLELRLYVGQSGEAGDFQTVLVSAPHLGPENTNHELTMVLPECEQWTDANLYFILTTTAYPKGELRGQIVAEGVHPTLQKSWGNVKASWDDDGAGP